MIGVQLGLDFGRDDWTPIFGTIDEMNPILCKRLRHGLAFRFFCEIDVLPFHGEILSLDSLPWGDALRFHRVALGLLVHIPGVPPAVITSDQPNSPTGLNIAAQRKAKRRPGYATARNAHCPEGAEQTVPTYTTDPNEFCLFRAISRWRTPYPGRRFALPWANMLLPHSGRIAKDQRIAGAKNQENELLKNSYTGL